LEAAHHPAPPGDEAGSVLYPVLCVDQYNLKRAQAGKEERQNVQRDMNGADEIAFLLADGHPVVLQEIVSNKVGE
jgi:hypothetical protein